MLRQVGANISYRAIRASKGKYARAEPVAARYEQSKVCHVGGFPALEDQLCTYSPSFLKASPDRLDALVYAITDLDSRVCMDISIDPNANYVPKVWI